MMTKDWLDLDLKRVFLPPAAAFLGLALMNYLGFAAASGAVLLGWCWLAALTLGAAWLERFFRADAAPAAQKGWLPVLGIVWTVWGALTLLLLAGGWFSASAALLAVCLVLLVLADVLPPVRLAARGFGEIIQAVLAGFAAPAWLFVLARGGWHRWLLLFGLPLTLAFLAGWLAWDFSTFAADQKWERRTLLTRLSWQTAVPLHHLFLLSAFALLWLDAALGVPWAVLWSPLLAVLLAFYQILMLHNIANGLPPLWSALKINALAIPLVMVYLLSLALIFH